MRRLGLLIALVWLVSGCAVQTAALQASPPAQLPPQVELAATPFFAQTDDHCGPAALATALGAIGIERAPEALAQQVFLPARGGSLQAEMLAGARRQGAVATRIPGTLVALMQELAEGRVAVVLLNLGLPIVPRWHYAVLVGYDLPAGEFVLRSGATRRDRMSFRTFEHTWARSGHWAVVITPPGLWPGTAQLDEVVAAAIGYERGAGAALARPVYASAVRRWPHSLPLAIGLGTAAEANGERALAIEVFRGAAERHGSGAAWLNLAMVLMREGRREEARAAASRALADPMWAGQARAWLADAQPTMRP